jgi:hypothetical protein
MKRLIKNLTRIFLTTVLLAAGFTCGAGEEESRTTAGGPEGVGEGVNPDEDLLRAHVCVLEMNFRTGPDADAARVKGHEALYWGVEFDVLAEEGDWIQVRLDDGTVGWLRAEYDGRRYISYANITGTETRMGSDEFLEFASAEAGKWDPGARLSFFCGSDGGLDGKCHCWRAFYESSAKPGKKMMCMLGDVENEIRVKGYEEDGFPIYDEKPAGEPGRELFAEEWDEDWRAYGVGAGDTVEVAPGPTWWKYYREGCEVAGPSFVSTRALCNHENVGKIISTAKTDIPEDLGAVAEDYEGFMFVVDKDRWKIIVPKVYEGDYVFVFGAADGRFVEFRDETL